MPVCCWEGIKVSMCCLRGALGPRSPLSHVCPRVFPAQERGEALALDNSPHLTRAHNTHPPDMSNDRSHGSRSKNVSAPGYFGYYYPSTHWLHTGTGNTNTRAELRPESSWCTMCVRAQSGPLLSNLSPVPNYLKWLSSEASECLSAPLCDDETLFVC